MPTIVKKIEMAQMGFPHSRGIAVRLFAFAWSRPPGQTHGDSYRRHADAEHTAHDHRFGVQMRVTEGERCYHKTCLKRRDNDREEMCLRPAAATVNVAAQRTFKGGPDLIR